MISILVPALFSLALSLPPQDASPPSQSANTAQSSGAFDQLAQAAKQAREEDRDDSAIDSYRQALLLKPEWDEGLWYLGTLLYKKENYFEACTVLRRFLAQNPGNGYGWAMLGLSEFESHDYTRALNDLQQGITLGLGDNRTMIAHVRYVNAVLLTRSEHFDESMALLFTLLTDGADASSLVEPFGLAALRLPFLPSEIPPGRRELIHMAGEATMAIEARKYEDAEKIFSDLEAKYPDQPGVHFLIGAYLLSAHPDDGIREMKQEIEISPAHVPARLRLAEEYIKRQNLDQGISLARETVSIAPDEPLAHMVLGEGLIAKGDAAGGMRELEAARDASPDMVRVHWDLVRAYTAAGRVADADREKSEIERISKQDEAR
jgi:tetratricopeptide (TPR) repeat protein